MLEMSIRMESTLAAVLAACVGSYLALAAGQLVWMCDTDSSEIDSVIKKKTDFFGPQRSPVDVQAEYMRVLIPTSDFVRTNFAAQIE